MAKNYRTEWDGLHRMEADLDRILKSQLAEAEGVVFEIGEELMSESKPLVPVDHGTLRSSGHVQPPMRRTRNSVEVVLGFGGPSGSGNSGESNEEDVGYAVRVHEDVQLFGTSPGGGTRSGTGPGGRPRIFVGQAKYLETPARRLRAKFGSKFARKMRSRRIGRR